MQQQNIPLTFPPGSGVTVSHSRQWAMPLSNPNYYFCDKLDNYRATPHMLLVNEAVRLARLYKLSPVVDSTLYSHPHPPPPTPQVIIPLNMLSILQRTSSRVSVVRSSFVSNESREIEPYIRSIHQSITITVVFSSQ